MLRRCADDAVLKRAKPKQENVCLPRKGLMLDEHVCKAIALSITMGQDHEGLIKLKSDQSKVQGPRTVRRVQRYRLLHQAQQKYRTYRLKPNTSERKPQPEDAQKMAGTSVVRAASSHPAEGRAELHHETSTTSSFVQSSSTDDSNESQPMEDIEENEEEEHDEEK
ncbi:hypothetical protein ACOMHN_025091 [Nucella lapillus]